jgi:acid phosphatase
MTAMASTKSDLSEWDEFRWKRTMEGFGDSDEAVIAAGPNGETDGIWQVRSLQ